MTDFVILYITVSIALGIQVGLLAVYLGVRS